MADRTSEKMGVKEPSKSMLSRRAIFLDRDGVIIENCPNHVKTWDDVKFLDGVFAALRRLADSTVAVVVVSNQGAVGRGMMSLDAAWEIQNRIVAAIEERGGRIDASYICPHHPDDGCDCRKPSPGMILSAAKDLNLDLTQSWLVGDAITDLEAASAAGIRGIMVRTGRGIAQERILAENQEKFGRLANHPWSIVADLTATLDAIDKYSDNES
jgi:D-glycero-D-manno-heptose 1,7-bisphosphate phosphatase